MLTITEWSKGITSLGLLPFFLFKIQALRSRFIQSWRLILYWTNYRITEAGKGITNLGLLPFFLFKIQALRSRFTQSRRPIFYWTKYATFPLKARPKTTDPFVFWQIFGDREYRCLDELKNVRLIIDCGANVGYSSAYFLTRFPTSHVIAVEPDIDNFDLLRTNLAPYGNRCRLVNSAVWSKATGLVFVESTLKTHSHSNPIEGACGRRVREARNDEKPAMIATDIGQLLKESGFDRISILKVDIEGAEMELFSSNYIEWLTQVDHLVIELHSDGCAVAFQKAITTEPFALSCCEELVVCKRFAGLVPK
jgi:FkbM family methyltransferase